MSDAAALSSIQASLEELTNRIDGIAGGHDGADDDPVAAGLFEVHRSLRTALRQLERVRGRL